MRCWGIGSDSGPSCRLPLCDTVIIILDISLGDTAYVIALVHSDAWLGSAAAIRGLGQINLQKHFNQR